MEEQIADAMVIEAGQRQVRFCEVGLAGRSADLLLAYAIFRSCVPTGLQGLSPFICLAPSRARVTVIIGKCLMIPATRSSGWVIQQFRTWWRNVECNT